MEIRLNKMNKIFLIVLSIVFILLLLFISPALARFKNRSINYDAVWSGNVASSYRSGNGTIDNPYIISNGEELAYFSSQLENNDYENSYFKIINHIKLNEGKFVYDDTIKYVLNGNTYYVSNNYYYDNEEYEGDAIGSINVLSSLNGFKGHLDGDSHVIYGLYLNGDNSGLFTNLNGDIKSLYISNAMINGNDSGILSNSINNGTITDIMVDGYIISDTVNDIDNDLEYIENNTYTVSGGISAYSYDSTFTNCINKAQINGSFISGGLIGYFEDSIINSAYSISNINSQLSNTIGIVKGTSTINKIYSTGEINGGLVGYVIDSDLSFSNSFIVTDNNLVLDISNSTIQSSNNYYTYFGRGRGVDSTFTVSTFLKDKEYLTEYHEFVSLEDIEVNSNNAWLFEDFNYPVLYIDDIVNPYVELHVGAYAWNSYSNILETKKYTDNITFMIRDTNNLYQYNKYYYISNSKVALSKLTLSSVEWTPYSDIVQIEEEGFYVIYVKVVSGDEVTFMNSDILILDNSLPTIDITLDDNHYDSINDGSIFIDHSFDVSISAEDTLSGVKSIEYYVSNDFLEDYDVEWTTYSNTISINNLGEYVIYVKVIDDCNYVTYACTPLIIFDGYSSTVNPIGFETGNSITSNSSIVFHFNYSNNTELDINHYLKSSIVLPRNTIITINDKTNNRVYGYTINTNDDFGFEENGYASYPFTLFSEKGKNTAVNYTEQEVSTEQFDVILDFSRTTISEDLDDIYLYIEGIDDNDEVLRTTINKKSFSIDSSRNVRISHSISSDFSNTLNYNSDSNSDVLISNVVQYNEVYDTSYFDKKIGLSIKLVDSSGRIINKEHLKNITFEVGNNKYIPSNDNIVRINLGTNISTNTTLSITTHRCTPKLRDGTYYIKINAYSSLDGLLYDSVYDNGIMIPIVVSKNINNTNYGFDVELDSNSRIIDKDGDVDLTFTIKQSGLDNPNIKVSLYKKDEVTAYNQDYSLIDLGDYTDDTLDEYIDSIYDIFDTPSSEEEFEITLDTTFLDRTSYKFVFDLYDGTYYVGSVSKNIIIR